ncbi:MAG: bis(5'-nucleosyl)-tetraphosphatase [Candidatus Heimdallarchaeaceae archaeon]
MFTCKEKISDETMVLEFERSAGIVIYNNGRYLLLNYGRSWKASNRWGFTKGHIEKNETVREAALREAFEETGISRIQLLDDFERKVTYYFNRGPHRIKKTVYYLIGITDQNRVHISSEHFGFYWATYEEALRMLTFENTRKILRAAEKFLQEKGLAVTSKKRR